MAEILGQINNDDLTQLTKCRFNHELKATKKELVALYLRYQAKADGLRSLPALSQVTAELA